MLVRCSVCLWISCLCYCVLDCCDSDLRWLLGRELLVLWILVGLVWLGIVIDAAIDCWFLGVSIVVLVLCCVVVPL